LFSLLLYLAYKNAGSIAREQKARSTVEL